MVAHIAPTWGANDGGRLLVYKIPAKPIILGRELESWEWWKECSMSNREGHEVAKKRDELQSPCDLYASLPPSWKSSLRVVCRWWSYNGAEFHTPFFSFPSGLSAGGGVSVLVPIWHDYNRILILFSLSPLSLTLVLSRHVNRRDNTYGWFLSVRHFRVLALP